jgi:exonuclease VII small subunit
MTFRDTVRELMERCDHMERSETLSLDEVNNLFAEALIVLLEDQEVLGAEKAMNKASNQIVFGHLKKP